MNKPDKIFCDNCHNSDFIVKYDKQKGKMVFICAKCDTVIM